MPTTEFPPHRGGVATLALEEALGLGRLGVGIRVEAVDPDPKAPRARTAPEADVRYSVIRTRAIARLAPLYRILSQAAAEHQPEFLYSPTYRGYGLPVRAVAAKHRIGFGLYIHGTEINSEGSRPLRRAIMQHVCARAAFLAFNSDHTRQMMEQAFPAVKTPSVVIPPGVDAAPFATGEAAEQAEEFRKHWIETGRSGTNKPGRPPVVIISLSRISREKGIDHTLRALAALKSRNPDLAFQYVAGGGGPDLAFFRQLAEELGLQDQVLFPGPIPASQMTGFLKSADFYVQPSQPVGFYVEGFGISFLEAHAAGLPCVATNWGGIPEAVVPGKTALLVPPGDLAALTDAIETLMTNELLRRDMSAASLERAAEMSWEAHCRKLFVTISDVLESGRRSV